MGEGIIHYWLLHTSNMTTKMLKSYYTRTYVTPTHLWCDGQSTIISAFGVWG